MVDLSVEMAFNWHLLVRKADQMPRVWEEFIKMRDKHKNINNEDRRCWMQELLSRV